MAPRNFQYRRARLEDLAKIGQLEKRVWKEMAASDQELRRRFFHYPQGFLVAVSAAEIAGFCSAVLSDRDAASGPLEATFPPVHVPRGEFLFLLGLTVNPIFRRLSIATSLVQRELEVAGSARVSKVQLIATVFSRQLFEKMGFHSLHAVDHLFGEFPGLMRGAVLMELATGSTG